MIAPVGPVYQAGTLSGNPLAMAAGIATLKVLRQPGFYEKLERKATDYATELAALATKYSQEITLNRVGSMMTGFFTPGPVIDFATAMQADADKYGRFYRAMLSQGIYLAPSQFEAAFISAAQTAADLQLALEMTESSFKKMLK